MSDGKQKLIRDVNFVLSECARIQGLVNLGNLKVIGSADFMSSLPHPNGRGQMLCGVAAAAIITELAKLALHRSRLSRRVGLMTARKELEKLFVYRFFTEQRDVDTKQIDRMLNAVAKMSRGYCVTITHLIPCHLMHSQEPALIKVGQVTFHNKSSINQLLIRKSRNADPKSEDSAYERRLLAKAIRYYRNFRWVAEVTISDCDAETSARLAQEAVTASLNCLHLLLGVNHSSRMRVGGADVRSNRSARITIGALDQLEPSVSFGYLGEVGFLNGWSEMLVTEDSQAWLNLFGIALEVTINPDLERPLCRRFVDALQWFGEAARDESAATKTVKYVTALERMLMTEERDDITSVVAERVAALCFTSEVSRLIWNERARDAYDLRSRLVHGSMSPGSLDLQEGSSNAASVASTALMHALCAFGEDALRDDRLRASDLADWFKRLVEWADREERAMEEHSSSLGVGLL